MKKTNEVENLTYTIEGKKVAEILGVQNFTTKEAAILELVKNAYDAGSKNLTIHFEADSLFIKDDGEGMTNQDIKESWMHIGKSTRNYYADSAPTRVTAGSKGIGRFALARLGKFVQMRTKKDNHTGVIWKTDWDSNTLELCETQENGTSFLIYGLRDNWSKATVKKLQKYLSIAYNDKYMSIILSKDDFQEEVLPYYSHPQIGNQFVTETNLQYFSNKMMLEVEISSDEFASDAQQYYRDGSIHTKKIALNMKEELQVNRIDLQENISLESCLKNIGDFKASFFFSMGQVSKNDKDTFLYKYDKLKNRYTSGITLYRNAFSISSYEGKKDWLGLSKRASSSPAAASHPSGNWHVRSSQLSGYIMIDKNKNAQLRELSNRQGLEENDHFRLFTEIILSGISVFERYRQSIVRSIKHGTTEDTSSVSTPLIQSIAINPTGIVNLNKKETLALAEEIKDYVQTINRNNQSKDEVIERFRYDTRILNVLATSGLKSASLAHELKNSKNTIIGAPENIESALKKFGMWDELNSPDKTKYFYYNVPLIISNLKESNNKISFFIESMLSDIEKQRFTIIGINLAKSLLDIATKWMEYYKWIKIDIINKDNVDIFDTSEDLLYVIFDNLILNSIQQNEHLNKLSIEITIRLKNSEALLFRYRDDGIGLPEKFIKEPYRIFNSHETNRPNGHGLGMWILKNTLDYCNGKIVDVPTDQKGFSLIFELGELKND